MELSVNAREVLRRRYLLKNDKGNIIETPEKMFARVAQNIAAVELMYNGEARNTAEEFYHIMANLEFLPNSPTLMNAGTKLQQLSACFVLPVNDSIDGIFDAVHKMAKIHQSGGGTGFSFSRLRPKGDLVLSTKGKASGPVSFMRVFDTATDVIKQGGKRRGANMAILSAYHPDIIEFAIVKRYEGMMKNFNLSIAVDDGFMKAVTGNRTIKLINPRTKKAVKKVNARKLFELFVESAWLTGDPGIVFIDEINRKHPLKGIGEIESTNPCGEQPLLPYESCNLGSINLAKMVKDKSIDWEKLRRTVRTSVHFLDNAIDACRFPLPETDVLTKANRKIGLGVMGFAEMLIQLGIPYDSNTALEAAENLMKFISYETRKKSAEIAMKKGEFPNFKRSIWYRQYKTMRNATVTTIAPTGTISIIADCSSGIEPLFAVSFVRNVMEGTKLLEVNQYFEKIAKERRFYSKKLMEEIAAKGSVQDVKGVPDDVKKVFVTAHDIKPEWHVKMQAAFQKYTDNAVSKTVNLRRDATKEDVKQIFLLAHELRCKGITVYRDGSKKEQVLNIGEGKIQAGSEYAGGCPAPYCPF